MKNLFNNFKNIFKYKMRLKVWQLIIVYILMFFAYGFVFLIVLFQNIFYFFIGLICMIMSIKLGHYWNFKNRSNKNVNLNEKK